MSSWRKNDPTGIVPTVKRLALAGIAAAALLAPGLARAELLPGSAGSPDAALAVAPDGSPQVAFTAADGSLALATRSADGVWSSQPLAGLPGANPFVVDLEVAPDGTTVLLAEDRASRWLDLAERSAAGIWTVRTVAAAPKNGLLGFGGLALDASGRPWVAYATELSSRKTWLRLVHEDAGGGLVGEAVTRAGFPSSEVLPAAQPVILPNGSVRVLEAYASSTIEWSRTRSHKDWSGQFVYASSLGSPAGVLRGASAAGGGVWSAWTELFPTFDESELLLTLHRDGEQTTILHTHAFLVSLVADAAGASVAGDDYVDLLGVRTVYAGLVFDPSGGSLELAGDLKGYAADPAGGRQYLLLGPDGLSWYRTALTPAARVQLSATTSGASFSLSGRVTGAAGGSVELWRETEAGSELVSSLPLAADGTFAATDLPPARPLVYRAVYRDPASGLPVASLVRTVLGA
jgi:hypothetical protein